MTQEVQGANRNGSQGRATEYGYPTSNGNQPGAYHAGRTALIAIAGQPVSLVVVLTVVLQTLGGLWIAFKFIDRADDLERRVQAAEAIDVARNQQLRTIENTITALSGGIEREQERQEALQAQINSMQNQLASMRERADRAEARIIRLEANMELKDRKERDRVHEQGQGQ